MPQILTPPASRPGSEAPEVEIKPAKIENASAELRQSLDTLLEQYLYLLDRQQEMQSGLSKQLSSGFLSLAHANYTCPPGRRYGADYYDDRMKATRKISIQTGRKNTEVEPTKSEEQPICAQSNDSDYCLGIYYTPRNKELQGCGIKEAIQSEDRASAMDENDTPVDDTGSAKMPTKEVKKSPSKFQSDNPIYWYGILVPPSLRAAQNSFTEGIQSYVPELAAVAVKMRAIEQQVIHLRARLEGESAKGTLVNPY